MAARSGVVQRLPSARAQIAAGEGVGGEERESVDRVSLLMSDDLVSLRAGARLSENATINAIRACAPGHSCVKGVRAFVRGVREGGLGFMFFFLLVSLGGEEKDRCRNVRLVDGQGGSFGR